MFEIPDIIEPESAFVANMRALWEHWPAFAQQLEDVCDSDLLACQRSRRGGLTCQVPGVKGDLVYLHSRYDPEKEAKKWVDGVMELAQKRQDDETGCMAMCYVVDGFGLGYHVRELYDRLLGEAFIIISEQNVGLIKTALHHFDYSEMLSSRRLIFITQTNRQEIFKKLQEHSTTMMLGIIFTHSLHQIDTGFHADIHKMINEYASYMRSHLITLLGNCMITCKNIFSNLPTYIGTKGINILKNRFKGYPAVVVSAGPSLQRNIDQLKDVRDKVVIIAVQTTLKPLIGRGIIPDFVTSLDYHEVSKRFFEGLDTDISDVHLVAEPKATWHVIDTYRKQGPISLLKNNIAELVLKECQTDHDGLAAGATVAHLAFYLADYIGAGPIIFIGQDLGFTNNVYYSPGNALHEVWQPELNRFCSIEMKEWERIARSRNMLRKVDDIDGNKIYTDEQMYTYLQQFEKDFAACSTKIIDATEGGVQKQFTETMTLKEAFEQYCKEPVDQDLLAYRKKIKGFDDSNLQKACEQLKKRAQEVEQLKDISEQTIALIKEMQDLVDDQPELNQRMIRLDELRTMVKHNEESYQLVRFVSQTAEMFRFRQDRSLELDGAEGKGKQRRQLQRDVAYVTEIKNGCDRMLDLLDQSVERFEEEIKN